VTRIPYPTDDELDEGAREILAALPPLNVARMFAGAPAALGPLTDLGQAILLRSELDPRLREIAILSVARATGSAYERAQHEALSRALEMSESDIAAASGGDLGALDDETALVARFAFSVARDIAAEADLTAEILAMLGRRQATELVVCCAYYSAIARIIATCGVELEESLPTANIDPKEWE